MTKSQDYIESKINAGGRTYAIKVTNEDKPFKVGFLDMYEKDLTYVGYSYELRTDAIRKCSELALRWIISGNYALND